MMEFEASFSKEEVQNYPHPHAALEALRGNLQKILDESEQNYLWYDITATNQDGGLKIVARLNESKKRYVIEGG